MVFTALTATAGKNLNTTQKYTSVIRALVKIVKMCTAPNSTNQKSVESLAHILSIYQGAVQQSSHQAYTCLNCKIKRSS